jgi:hypothetical protein
MDKSGRSKGRPDSLALANQEEKNKKYIRLIDPGFCKLDILGENSIRSILAASPFSVVYFI